MPDYTENLQLEQPLDEEQYDVAVTRRNNQKIDDFSQTMPKLYSTSGDNTDGAMTQKASTDYIKEVIEILYPVGSIYIGTQAVCPLETLEIGTWELVAADKALWTGDGTNANTTIAAGLPNIKAAWAVDNTDWISGAVYASGNNNNGAAGSSGYQRQAIFNASRSNSIYGNSSTVQPPAYVVNVWRRVE